ncbi:predicted protein [Chaetoceros tenuissimus]|uniref:Uncharacterized protein n=1 Tax=Chaetoceros tenuissimus TaxID=426638 RepID=A0AAD3CYK3_9STRA|nr:predicted protein [Chaetoceros tenuissimus]
MNRNSQSNNRQDEILFNLPSNTDPFMLKDLSTMNEFQQVLSQIKKEGGNTRDALHAMFYPDYRGMHPRFALEIAIKELKEFLLRFRSRRSHGGDDDFIESGECPETDGVALENADNATLLREILRKDDSLQACHKEIATLHQQSKEAQKERAVEKKLLAEANQKAEACHKEIATLRQQSKEAQEERAVEKKLLAEANQKAKAIQKILNKVSDAKGKLKVECNNLQVEITTLKERLSKQSNCTDVDARPVSPTPPTLTQNASSPTQDKSSKKEQLLDHLDYQLEEFEDSPSCKYMDWNGYTEAKRADLPQVSIKTTDGQTVKTYEPIQKSLFEEDGITPKGASELHLTVQGIAKLTYIFLKFGNTVRCLKGKLGKVAMVLSEGNFDTPEGTITEICQEDCHEDIEEVLEIAKGAVGHLTLERFEYELGRDFLTNETKVQQLYSQLTPEEKADPDVASRYEKYNTRAAEMKSISEYFRDNIYKPMFERLKEEEVIFDYLHVYSTDDADRVGIESGSNAKMLQEVVGHPLSVVRTKHLTHGLLSKTLDDASLNELLASIRAKVHFIAKAVLEDYSEEVIEECFRMGSPHTLDVQLSHNYGVRRKSRSGKYNLIIERRRTRTLAKKAKKLNMSLKELRKQIAKKIQDARKETAQGLGISIEEFNKQTTKKGLECFEAHRATVMANIDAEPLYLCNADGVVHTKTFAEVCVMIEKKDPKFMDEKGVVIKNVVRERVLKYRLPSKSKIIPLYKGGPVVATSHELCWEKYEKVFVDVDSRVAKTDAQPLSYCYDNGVVHTTSHAEFCVLIAKNHGDEFMDEKGEVDKKWVRDRVQQTKGPTKFKRVCNKGPVVATDDDICSKKHQYVCRENLHKS